MNNDQVNAIIQGISICTELWTITYNGFVSQGLNDQDALIHTRAFMSIMLDSFIKKDTDSNN